MARKPGLVLHDLGHAIGLDHEPTQIAVMNPFNNAALTFGPLPDDLIGIGEIYGEAGAAGTSFLGSVGIGTASPSEALHIRGTDAGPTRVHIENTNTATGAHAEVLFTTSDQSWKISANEFTGDINWIDNTNGTAPLTLKNGAPTNSLFVAASGNVGIGTSTPEHALHVQRSDGTAQLFVEETSGASTLRTLFKMINNGPVNTQHKTGAATWRQQFQNNAYTVTKDGTGGNEVTIIANTGDMSVRGSLTTGGPTCGGGCDELFSPRGEVESIEEHAALMWENSHLPGVGPTTPGEPINISEKIGGLINELEKAHIYIERLHERLVEEQSRNDALENRLARLETMLAPQTADD